MAALLPLAPIIAAGAAVGSTAYAIASGGGAKINQPQLAIARDDASSMLSARDALAARRGGASDILNGDAGITQTMPGPKTVLGN